MPLECSIHGPITEHSSGVCPKCRTREVAEMILEGGYAPLGGRAQRLLAKYALKGLETEEEEGDVKV